VLRGMPCCAGVPAVGVHVVAKPPPLGEIVGSYVVLVVKGLVQLRYGDVCHRDERDVVTRQADVASREATRTRW
jgi:hypothetical protein